MPIRIQESPLSFSFWPAPAASSPRLARPVGSVTTVAVGVAEAESVDLIEIRGILRAWPALAV
jgi:hypothetical protein